MAIVILIFLFSLPFGSRASVRIKDITDVQGVRQNVLIGYGLVVGLKGTGDSSSTFTAKSLQRMLEKFGVAVDGEEVKSQNVAAVIVSSSINSFARKGSRIDVTVSSIGDASSIMGGTLIATPMLGGDKQVYAVSQGIISMGGLQENEGVSTIGRVPNGAYIENEIPSNFSNRKGFRLALKESDFTTAARIAKAVNSQLGGKYALAKDSGTIDIVVPFGYEGNTVELLALIENTRVVADGVARVVLNERTGTVVAGENVRIESVALSHGDLVVQVGSEDDAAGGGRSLAGAGGAGDDEGGGNTVNVLKRNASVGDLAKTLNTLGVKPKDLIAIFQALKVAGALRAELEIL